PKIIRDLAVDVPTHARALEDLAEEIEAGVLAPLTAVEDDDAGRFAVLEPYVGGPWTALPWYVGEAFLYARLRRIVGWAAHGADPFLAAKQREEATLPPDAEGDDLDTLLLRTLWGNRGDLSLPSARGFTHEHADDLVADDRDAALQLLRDARSVGIVLDNAGLELFRDLQLARRLVAGGARVTLYAKDRPFFVSDALPIDVERTRQRLKDVDVEVVSHPFFTGPAMLTSSALPAALSSLWSTHDVVVSKGDCNYRRLVGDAPFDPGDRSAFADRVSLPVPVIAVRTLKAEVLVGADSAVVARIAAGCDNWLVTGRFGVVQVANTNIVVDSTGDPA
ncbi:MAG TPA: ARMT1-like domain-containing protein, partial [Myxococcota bacterium]